MMNERIKELATQAGEEIKAEYEDESRRNRRLYNEIFLPKFAELIVKECIEQINKVEEKGDAHLGGGYFYDGTRLCRDAIKQHFGVEE